MATSWLRATVPTAIDLALAGRTPLGDVTSTTLGTALGNALTACMIGIACTCLLRPGLDPSPDPIPLAITLLPWVFLELASYYSGAAPSVAWIAFPLFCAALWRSGRTKEIVTLYGRLTAITATMALVACIWLPTVSRVSILGLTDEKSPWGYVLSGFSAQSNVLAITLTLGLPACLTLRNRLERVVYSTTTLAALILTFSRTALIAASVVLAIGAILAYSKPLGRFFAGSAILVGGCLIIATPLMTTSPSAFSDRGQIWSSTLADWKRSPVFGMGPDYFSGQAATNAAAARLASHGHNMLVQLLATSGILGAISFSVLLIWVSRRSLTSRPAGETALLLGVVALVLLFWLEGAFRLNEATGVAFWLALTLPAFALSGSGASIGHIEATADYSG